MPYQILKKGKEYILKSPTRQYKHKSLAKAKAQKRLLEEKEGKVVQTQKVSQKVTVIVNAPKRRAGQARKQTVPQAQTFIQMRPVVPSNPMEAYYGTARPQPRSLLSGDEERIRSIEANIRQLREPFMERMKEEPYLDRVPSKAKLDTDFFSRELEEFMKTPDPRDRAERLPVVPEIDLTQQELVTPRTGRQRLLTVDSVFNGATIGQLLQGDYGETPSGKTRTEPTAYQKNGIRRWKAQNP